MRKDKIILIDSKISGVVKSRYDSQSGYISIKLKKRIRKHPGEEHLKPY